MLDQAVERRQDELIKAVQEMIALRSEEGPPGAGAPFGEAVGRALDRALAIAAGLGFKTVNLDGYAGYAEYGSGDDYIAVLGHLDVVPAGDGWTYPPYGGEIHAGRLYGRGAADDKGPIMAALYGLAAVKELGLPLSKRVRIIFGTNEETGCRDLDYYAAREPAPAAGFTPDACFPVIHAEKGNCEFTLTRQVSPADAPLQLLSLHSGERVNIVPARAEAVLLAREPQRLLAKCAAFRAAGRGDLTAVPGADGQMVISACGKAAHASLPQQGSNAAMLLADFLSGCPLPPDLGAFFRAISRLVGRETDGGSLGIACQDAESGGLTLNAGLLRFDGNTASLTCDVRFPVSCSGERLLAAVRRAAAGSGLELADCSCGKPLYFSPRHPLVATLQAVYAAVTGDAAKPLAIGGGTYAKHLANTVAFGPQFPGQPDVCHQADEYIALDDLRLCAKLYARAIYAVAK
ncbi:MAG: dipeptidase PepV [Sporomusaceae bacterium]|nr:dipeptidase PepV [Sporomusaceae bacterium]